MGKASEDETGMLTAIKVLHTVVWAFFAAAIVALPFLAVQGAFRWAAILLSLIHILLFGRAAEEMDALNEAGIPYEIVPGISAAFAAAEMCIRDRCRIT